MKSHDPGQGWTNPHNMNRSIDDTSRELSICVKRHVLKIFLPRKSTRFYI
ncbi:hypothetical protein YC2023_015748 [Brassica napus]